jgi:hypothetical protein
MDVNSVTLEYLMNPHHYDRYIQKQTGNCENNDKKLKFYKKRILAHTKEMIKGTFLNNTLHQSFNDYTDALISYFEFADKKDIIQEEYSDLIAMSVPSPTSNEGVLMSYADDLIINTPPLTRPTLDNFVVVKNKQEEKRTIPMKKEINITDPKFKYKGINRKKKKNIN